MLCDHRLIDGSNWSKHKGTHKGTIMREGVEFVQCLGDDCPFVDNYKTIISNRKRVLRKCTICEVEKRNECMSKENNGVCLVCEKRRKEISMPV